MAAALARAAATACAAVLTDAGRLAGLAGFAGLAGLGDTAFATGLDATFFLAAGFGVAFLTALRATGLTLTTLRDGGVDFALAVFALAVALRAVFRAALPAVLRSRVVTIAAFLLLSPLRLGGKPSHECGIHRDGTAPLGRYALKAAAIDLPDIQVGRFDSGEAAYVHACQLVAVLFTFRERRNATNRAKVMGNRMFVEAVGADIDFRRLQPKLLIRHEPHQVTLGSAMRTIALQHGADFAIDVEGDPATMTSTMPSRHARITNIQHALLSHVWRVFARYPIDPHSEPTLMRSFDDHAGGHWQAALMEASFGNVLLIFSRIGAEGAMKKPLDSVNLHAAEQWLAGADEATLRGLLAEAVPWN